MSSLLTHTGETSAKCVSVGDTAGSYKGNLRKKLKYVGRSVAVSQQKHGQSILRVM